MSALPRPAETAAALRRGWCPSTLKPMQTGDGWLVRLHPPGGVLTPGQIVRIAALAREHGNGLIEISARGNLQLRGVSAETHPALVAALLTESLVDEHNGDGPQRLTLVSPVADDVAAALADDIETHGRAIPGLPAKTLVVVDGGGAMSLDGFAADLRVVGVAGDAVAIGLPGGVWLGTTLPETPDAVAAILRGFAARHAAAPDTVRRLRDLPAEEQARLSRLPRTQAPAPRPAPRRVGSFDLGAGRFSAMVGLPFGRSDAAVLTRLGESAKRLGAQRLRLSPWRGLACVGLAAAAARSWLHEAASLGLITDDGDARLSVEACAGKPACLRAQTDAMGDAARLAEAAALLLSAGVSLHVSGCVKSCAHPGAADLTLVGREGRYGVVQAGTTRDAALAELDLSEILRRLAPGQDLFGRLLAGRISGPQV